jgi:hypothetical protein
MEVLAPEVAEMIADAVREQRELTEQREREATALRATERRLAEASAKVAAILKLAGRERMPRSDAGKARKK